MGPRGGEAGASPRSTPLRCRAAPAPGPKQGEAKQGGRWVQEAGTGQPGVPARQRPARWRGTYQCVPREHLQQRDEVVSIPQVFVEVVDVALRLQGREAALPRCHAQHQLPLAAPAPLRRALARERQGETRTPPPQGARTRPAWCPTAGPDPGPASPCTLPQAQRAAPSLHPRDPRPGGLGAGSFMHVAPPPTVLVAAGPSAPVRVKGSSEKRKERGEGQPVPGEGAHLPLLASAAARRRAREKRERLGEAGGEETGWRPGARGHPEVPSPRHSTRRRRAGPPARGDMSARGGRGRRLGVCQALTRALPAAQQGRVPARSQGPGWVWQERGAGGTGERECGGREDGTGPRQSAAPGDVKPLWDGANPCGDKLPGWAPWSQFWRLAGSRGHQPAPPPKPPSPAEPPNLLLQPPWKVPAHLRPGHGPQPHVGGGGTAVMGPGKGRGSASGAPRSSVLCQKGPSTGCCCGAAHVPPRTSRSGAAGQAGWGFERPGPVGEVPAHVRGLEPGAREGPFQPNRSAIP